MSRMRVKANIDLNRSKHEVQELLNLQIARIKKKMKSSEKEKEKAIDV